VWQTVFQQSATNVLLEVECAPGSQANFEQRYQQATGSIPTVGDHYQMQSGKWGLECRAYFDGPDTLVNALNAAGYHVEARTVGYGSEREWRVNTQDFFWELVSLGYRLGPN
jgi:hypothetical protein